MRGSPSILRGSETLSSGPAVLGKDRGRGAVPAWEEDWECPELGLKGVRGEGRQPREHRPGGRVAWAHRQGGRRCWGVQPSSLRATRDVGKAFCAQLTALLGAH